MATKIPVLVPFRTDNGAREANWTYINGLIWDPVKWIEVVMGESPEGPFNLSAARNDAVRKLPEDWDIAVFADADSFVDIPTLETAVAVARNTQNVVLPHSRWVNVSLEERHTLLVDQWLPFNPKRTIHTGTKSSVLVIPRAAYDAVNGFDERFRGWGWEDTAFFHAVEHLYAPVTRFEGNVYHLEHERPAGDVNRALDENSIRNRQHFGNYKRARNEQELRKLILGNRVTL